MTQPVLGADLLRGHVRELLLIDTVGQDPPRDPAPWPPPSQGLLPSQREE